MKDRAVRSVPYLLAFFSSLCIMILELVASRLVARHVGASLSVWTSVIGIMLGGICLGNVLGGRLADRIAPRRAIGPLYAFGSLLTLGCLWANAVIGLVPSLNTLPLSLETVLVVSFDFLIPGTVLGMIGPVVAKMAVEQARRSGGALGDVYFMGAFGSIVGTFLAGFYLMYLAPTSTIVVLVAAALAMLAAVLANGVVGAILGVVTSGLLISGAIATITAAKLPGMTFGGLRLNLLELIGSVSAVLMALESLTQVRGEPTKGAIALPEIAETSPVKLGDLAALTFISSLVFMSLEMVAGRMVTMHTGSSIYGWTSVIGVLLGGLSLGNWLGGKIANRVTRENQASWLFLVASILVALIVLEEHPPSWFVSLVRSPIESLMQGKWVTNWDLVDGKWVNTRPNDHDSFLLQAASMTGKEWSFMKDGYPWGFRVLFWVALMFLLPAMAMGTVGPVVAKLAVDRVRARTKGTGAAIGTVYAWGMIGSILGTFLTGFLLVDLVGTKGMVVLMATTLALAATYLGTVWHAAWAGIPLGMCVIAFLPSIMPQTGVKPIDYIRLVTQRQGRDWGLREEPGNPDVTTDDKAYVDESNYYYIKVDHNPLADGGQKRTLVLDNLIHGYFIKDHPERLDYDYEHIYALVARRVMEAKAKAMGKTDLVDVPLSTMFLGGGSYTFPRYLQAIYPGTTADVAEIDPAVTEANHLALWLPRDTSIKTTWGDARQFVVNRNGPKYDMVFGDAFNDFSVPWHLTTKEFNDRVAGMLTDEGVYMINIIDIFRSDQKATVKGLNQVEIDTVAQALSAAGAPDALPMARKVVSDLDDEGLGLFTGRLADAARDALADVPTRTDRKLFESKLAAAFRAEKVKVRGDFKALSESAGKIIARKAGAKSDPGRVEALARAVAEAEIKLGETVETLAPAAAAQVAEARYAGAFLGSWVETARKSFGDNIYVFGTASYPGHGERETFVVVASRKPLDLARLGTRDTDPHFFEGSTQTQVVADPYEPGDMKALTIRSRGITLTDDYAPVENLLAPVAETRKDD